MSSLSQSFLTVPVLVVAHGVTLTLTLLNCWLAIPDLQPCWGVDPNPSAPTVFVFELARWIRKCPIIAFSFAGAFLVGDGILYVLLRDYVGKRSARVWFWCLFAFFVCVFLFVEWTSSRPV